MDHAPGPCDHICTVYLPIYVNQYKHCMYVYDNNVLKCLGLILLWTLDIVTCMCIALGGGATYCGQDTSTDYN